MPEPTRAETITLNKIASPRSDKIPHQACDVPHGRSFSSFFFTSSFLGASSSAFFDFGKSLS